MQIKSAVVFGISFIIFTSIAILIGKGPAPRQDMGLSVYEFCQKHGYKLEDATFVTEDGYILTMHRIRCPRNQTNCKGKKKRPPVLLMHGIFGSSVDYIAQGPDNSLAFQLADKGYDVWLGNQRGNTFSRQHIMLEADDDALFWDFSFDQIGAIDVPAMVDYVIAKTNFSKISYVGMSQGALAYLVMTSLKPEYNDKILISNLMSPVITLYNTKNIIFRIWSMFNFFVEPIVSLFGDKEMGGNTQIVTNLARYLCIGPHLIGNWFCTEYLVKVGFGSSDQLNYNMLPFYISNTPAGASLKQFRHFAQNKIKGQLAQYDYYDQNEEHYNKETPPIYNLTKSTAPLSIYYSRGDTFTNVASLYQELKNMPNVVLKYKVPYAQFNHLDFIFAKNLSTLVNNKVIEMIDQYNKRH